MPNRSLRESLLSRPDDGDPTTFARRWRRKWHASGLWLCIRRAAGHRPIRAGARRFGARDRVAPENIVATKEAVNHRNESLLSRICIQLDVLPQPSPIGVFHATKH